MFLPLPILTLKSKEQGTKTHLCPSWPQSNWQHVAQYCWQHWEVPLGNVLLVGFLGELDTTSSEGGKHSSPQAWDHKIQGSMREKNDYSDFLASTGFHDSRIKIFILKSTAQFIISHNTSSAHASQNSCSLRLTEGFCYHLVC